MFQEDEPELVTDVVQNVDFLIGGIITIYKILLIHILHLTFWDHVTV